MSQDTQVPPSPAAPSAGELLSLAQNPHTAPEVLEQISNHPALSPDALTALLRHPATPGRGITRLAGKASGPILEVLLGSLERLARWVDALEALLSNPAVPDIKRSTITEHLQVARKREAEGHKRDLLTRIRELPVGQKLTLAKKGNKDVRMILIKDPNEMVALEVASSPRITDGEILAIAMMRDVSDKVLRLVANNRKYRQNHQILVALVNNPRTPVGVSLGLGLHTLTDRELSDLSKNRNIPGAVSRAAVQVMDRRKGGTTGGGRGGH
jgi:hypothetical protein